MGRREAAREESAFLRGDVGVDGAATEDKQDVAEVERDKAREQFLRGKAYLGREFLTWLLFKSEAAEPVIKFDGEPLTVLLIDRLLLRGIHGDVVEMTLKGAMAPYSPIVRRSLDRGLLIHQTRLRLIHGERTFEVTVDAEHMDFKSAKLPELLSEEEDDQVQERLFLAEHLSSLVTALVEDFLRLRASKKWTKDTVPAMKAWMKTAADER